MKSELQYIRRRAMDLLARREHSAVELIRKLTQKGFPAPLVEEVVAALTADNLQSDERFVVGYIRSRAERGYGPIKIQHELVAHGIAEELINEYLHNSGIDWYRQAYVTWYKRFGNTTAKSYNELARQQRFLQYKGYSAEQIKKVVE